MSSVTQARARRHRRVRKKISGTPERPRLAVFVSNKHLYAQLIDDQQGRTLASASTLDPELKGSPAASQAESVGRLVAEKAGKAGITTAVFDRGGFLFHGRVKQIADAARENGLRI